MTILSYVTVNKKRRGCNNNKKVKPNKNKLKHSFHLVYTRSMGLRQGQRIFKTRFKGLDKREMFGDQTPSNIGDRFREHLRDVEKDDQNASKPVARHFNLSNHSNQHMVVCGLSLHQGSTESRKTLEQKFIFQIGTLNPNGINERFSFN